MSEVKITLLHGYKLGESILKDAFIRPYNTADLMDAEEESEKLILAANSDGVVEHKLVLSPALYGRNIFRRQITRFDDVSGPFGMTELKENLHPDDYALLQLKADELDQAVAGKEAIKAVSQRGRSGEDDSST